VTLTLTLAYLEVPIVNAPLFATALTLQAALGTVAITWLLKGAQPSLLLLLGPGLILGGALSFALFQLVGRGVVGVLITFVAGIGATLKLGRSRAHEGALEPRWFALGQLLGMGALAITSEFEALLPVAIAFFSLGLVAGPSRRHQRTRVLILSAVGFVVAITALIARRADWWVVTDDYYLLEVVARHITTEGPFSNWGLTNYSRYHWLAYGWSGLLDLIALNPGPLVTLTRVMPIIYAISLAASVCLVSRRVVRQDEIRTASLSRFLPAWTVISVGKFEWTGTSTGGAYAIVAAVLSVSLTVGFKRLPTVRQSILLTSFVIIALLTKLPTIFGLGLVALIFISLRMSERIQTPTWRWLVSTLTLVLAVSSIFTSIWIFGRITDRIHFARVNPGLGQLSEFGRLFAGTLLILSQFWLWSALLVAAGLMFHRSKVSRPDDTFWLLPVGSVSLVSAWLLELSLSGLTNTYSYFSGPLYFVSSLVLLHLENPNRAESAGSTDRRADLAITTGVVVAGLTWGVSSVVRAFWETAIRIVPTAQAGGLELLVFFTRDVRVGATLVALALLIGVWRLPRIRERITRAWTTALVLLTFASYFGAASVDFDTSSYNSATPPGSTSRAIYEVGQWIRTNTRSNDLLATNYFFEETGGSIMELELAAWSQREFLVLGPQITGRGETWTTEETRARDAAIDVSESFSHEPTDLSCGQLRQWGVKWYVVDKSKTINRDWSVCSSVEFSNELFLVLSLGSFDKPAT
jgi:hypothetical protein